MNDQIPLLRRMDLAPELVKAARLAASEKAGDGEEIYFRPVLEQAIVDHLKKVKKHLGAAGFAKRRDEGEVEKRQRPVNLETWDMLGGVAQKYGVSRISLVRACLRLSATQS